MEFGLVERIASQLPPRVMVQLHNNGEPLLYRRFGEAVRLFSGQITNIVTNGKLLLEKREEVVGNLDTMAISVIENDPEADRQFRIIEEFLRLKGTAKPFTILRLNGEVDQSRYLGLGVPLATRPIHAPLGSFNYRKHNPTIPEVGICLDLLNHMAIDRFGEVSICVRFDPNRLGVIGHAERQPLEEIWNGEKRLGWLDAHRRGRRDLVPLCSYCHFWGVPTGLNCQSGFKEVEDSAVVSASDLVKAKRS